jgi:alpha-beta hydrolase superfamily lysophospholipase
MSSPIALPNSKTQYLIERPLSGSTTAIIFLPGISGGVFLDRFQPLVDACLSSSFAIVRIAPWTDADDAGTKNFVGTHSDIQRVVDTLKQQGYTTFYGIGKSLGGAVMLTLPSIDVSAKVLWAPAIGVTSEEGSYHTLKHAELSTISSPIEITLDKTTLSQCATPTLFIHGTADPVIPIDNSQTMVSMMPHASLAVIEGADHSYKIAEHEAEVIEKTIHFFKTQTNE